MLWDYFEDVTIGKKVVSRGRTMTETDVVMYCMLTGNWETLHSDVEDSKKTRWGQRLVQMALVFSVSVGLVPVATPGRILAAYGIDHLRAVKPTFIGDTIHVEHEIIKKDDVKPDAGIVTIKMTVKNQRDETVQVYEDKLLVAKRPKTEA